MNTLVTIFHLITTRLQENNQDIIEVLFVSLRSFCVNQCIQKIFPISEWKVEPPCTAELNKTQESDVLGNVSIYNCIQWWKYRLLFFVLYLERNRVVVVVLQIFVIDRNTETKEGSYLKFKTFLTNSNN